MSGTGSEPGGYRVGDVFIAVGTRQVSRDGKLLQLPPLSFDLLLALVRRAPNAVSSGELMEQVWTGRVVNDETIAKRVELVREALGDDSRQSRYIALVRGHGYRITANVERVTEAAPATAPATAALPSGLKREWTIGISRCRTATAMSATTIRRSRTTPRPAVIGPAA